MALCIGIFGQSFAAGLTTAAPVDIIKREMALSGYAGAAIVRDQRGRSLPSFTLPVGAP